MIAACLTAEVLSAAAAREFVAALRAPPKQTYAALKVPNAVFAASTARATVAHGWTVLLAGQLHNRRQLAHELAIDSLEVGTLYAAALERWGDQADEHCIGHYAAIALSTGGHALRLARSPFAAPPLHFRSDGTLANVTQQPRSLFWQEPVRPAPDLTRIAQSLIGDGSDRFRSWYEGAQRLPLGCAVSLLPETWREVWRYDLFARPQIRLPSPQAYATEALRLLDEGVAAALEDTAMPGVMLSGGLDSALVATSALRAVPEAKPLHSFTFGPTAGWQTEPAPGTFLSDFPLVEKFAAMHPRIVPHYETNPGRDFRHLQRDLAAAIDGAPAALGLAWIEHDLFEQAQAVGCDTLLCGTWGNFTFSSRGPWAFSEFLRRGRWCALIKALQSRHGDLRPLWRRFAALAVAPLLPRGLWAFGQRWLNPARRAALFAYAVNPTWPGLSETQQNARAAGYNHERLHPASKRAHWQALLAEDGQERDQYVLGMELLHGITLRDPTAYRPLVEFCWGCPTDVFMRGSTDRWLARGMARGQMPEAQRLNRNYGKQFVDWQPRLASARAELLADMQKIADDPDIAAVIDLPRLMRLLEDLPAAAPVYDPVQALPYLTAVPIGYAAARFMAYAKGRNDI